MKISHILTLCCLSFACLFGGLAFSIHALIQGFNSGQTCTNQVLEWTRMVGGDGIANDPKQFPFFATELAKVTLACGNGNVLGKQIFAPAEVLALARNPEIIERAKAALQLNH